MFHLGIIFLITYLVGSINFGLILGYIHGLDLRSQGSGNAGATNALRILGLRSGVFVFFGDAFKGYIALYLCDMIVTETQTLLFAPSDYLFFALIFSFIGHCYPIWFNFKGGKGAATALGAFLFIDPYFILFPVLGFLFVFLISRFVGLATISAFFLLFAQSFFIDHGVHHNLHAFSLIILLLILYTHRSNIQSMFEGTEAKL
ncbi:MAG: acyl-phosphate glycerol 3-phosphate acyltransferase [Gammaproteobacteria bacterium]|nr:acyl-phosphate glycerol 3-phosphate acyltransferase [Gammaproteobacteria bacterium]